MSRDEIAKHLAQFITSLMDVWEEVFRDERLESHVVKALRVLGETAVFSGKPAAPLESGETETLEFALPPNTTKDPVAGLKISLSDDGRSGQAQLLLFAVPSGNGTNRNTPWICARFESPESAAHADDGHESRHDFHHAQISNEIRSLDGSTRSDDHLPAWFPTSALAIPVPAADPLDLCLCAFLSVRHPDFLRQIVRTSGQVVASRAAELLRPLS
ncbi:MAG TPA: hypothetical protein VJP78_07545 [Thermoleophilia bacterium]|nr:hypothetical protein [Thermoleophilia bacterium]